MIIDEEDYLEHFGKKGMKWGVRREVRLQSLKNVGEGKGGAVDKFLSINEIPPNRYFSEKGLQGAAKLTAKYHEERRNRILKGEHTVKDLLINVGNSRYSDLLDRDVRTQDRLNEQRQLKKEDKVLRKALENQFKEQGASKADRKQIVKKIKKKDKEIRADINNRRKAQKMGR